MKRYMRNLFGALLFSLATIGLASCKKNHTHDYQREVTKEATCTEKGTAIYKCECGETKEQEETIPALGHDYGEYTVKTPATHAHKGLEEATCNRCGAKDEREIDAIPHDEVTTWESDSTKHWHVCPTCGDKFNEVEHTFTDPVITPGTGHGTNISTKTCTVCGKEVTETISADGHNIATTWGHDDTNHYHECSCGVHVDVAEHEWDEGTTTRTATPTQAGIVTYTCNVCKATKEVEVPYVDGSLKAVAINTKYIAGTYLEYTDLKVELKNASGVFEETTNFTFDLEGVVLTTSHTKTTVTCGGYTVDVAINVVEAEGNVEGLELIVEKGLTYSSKVVVSEHVLYRVKYTNGSYSDYAYPKGTEITLTQNHGHIIITMTKNLFGTSYSTTAEIENPVTGKSFTLPTKTIYAVGEELNLVGGKLHIIYAYGEDDIVDVTPDMITCPTYDKNTEGVYPAVLTFDGVEYKFNVEVVEQVTGAELVGTLPADKTFLVKDSLKDVAAAFGNSALQLHYSDSSKDKTIALTENMLSYEGKWEIGTKTITLSYLGYTTTFDITIDYNGKTIGYMKDSPVDTQALVTGVVIGYNYSYVPGSASSADIEVIVKDLTTNRWMTLTNAKNVYVGDIIEFQGKVIASRATSIDPTFKRLEVVSGLTVIDHTNKPEDIQLDLSDAVTITTHAQWKEIFSDANRPGTFDTIYKLHANVRGVAYNGDTYRVVFPGCTTYGSTTPQGQYFSGNLSGVIRSAAVEANTSYLMTDLFGASGSYTGALQAGQDIYVIYCGPTSTWYADFVILGDYCIQDYDPIIEGYEYTPTYARYELGQDVDITDEQIKIKYYYSTEDSFIDLTSDMLVYPENFNKNVAGEYEIGVKLYGEIVDTFTVIYQEEVYTSIATCCECRPEVTGGGQNILDMLDYDSLCIKAINTLGIEKEIPMEKSMLTVLDGFYLDEDIHVVKTVLVTYQELTTQFEVVVLDAIKSVESIKELTTGASATFLGVVIGTNLRGNATHVKDKQYPEIIVKDLTTNYFVMVRGTYEVEVGDVITFEGSLAKGTETADKGMNVFASATVQVIRKATEQEQQMDLTKAIELTNMTEFTGMFDTADERVAAQGQVYKLTNARALLYSGDLYRFYLSKEDGTSTTTYADVKIGGNLCPTLKKCVFESMCTKSLEEVFGDAVNNNTWGNANNYAASAYDIYVIYVGGTGAYYGDFIILGDYAIQGGVK